MKKCTGCNVEKELTEFYKKKIGKYGVAAECRNCSSERSKQTYKNNPERGKINAAKWAKENREKRKKITDKYYVNNREKAGMANRKSRIKKEYGLTEEQYEEMLRTQNGKCKICGSKKSKIKTHDKMIIDHCHVTGKVRGLLCNKCNLGLGRFNDDIELLQKAIEYLKQFK